MAHPRTASARPAFSGYPPRGACHLPVVGGHRAIALGRRGTASGRIGARRKPRPGKTRARWRAIPFLR
jgi:hypothetical protein